MVYLEGSHKKVKTGHSSENWQDLGNMPLLESQGECFGISKKRFNWSIQTKNSGVLVILVGFLSKGCTYKGKSWVGGGTIYHKGLEEVTSGTYIYL